MKKQLLLLEDIDGLGRGGDIVTAKLGYIRNYLLPKKKGVIASERTIKLQAQLQEERKKRAEVDRKESEEVAARLDGETFLIEVKVDPEGHMYGSVATGDIVRLLSERNIEVDKKNVLLPQPIRSVGTHPIRLRLKEGMSASFTLNIVPEGKETESQAKEGAKTIS